jgi:glycosyltransferase involved in cell wall biosynthesis
MELQKGSTTICIVNYKTEELTKLCLRSIRKFTKSPYKVVVVDNDSADGSLDYLRTLDWITLIERPGEVVKSGSWAHGTALDKGLEICDTEFFIAMHSDTFVHKEGWLSEFTGKMSNDYACAGGGKLDLKPALQVFLKKITDVKAFIRKKKKNKRDDFYIRTICALYRTEVLKKENLTFSMDVDKGVTCGKQLYYEIIDRGYNTNVISEWDMAKWIYHLAHATMVLNPEFTVRSRTEKKCKKKIEQILSKPEVKSIINDNSLD